MCARWCVPGGASPFVCPRWFVPGGVSPFVCPRLCVPVGVSPVVCPRLCVPEWCVHGGVSPSGVVLWPLQSLRPECEGPGLSVVRVPECRLCGVSPVASPRRVSPVVWPEWCVHRGTEVTEVCCRPPAFFCRISFPLSLICSLWHGCNGLIPNPYSLFPTSAGGCAKNAC